MRGREDVGKINVCASTSTYHERCALAMRADTYGGPFGEKFNARN